MGGRQEKVRGGSQISGLIFGGRCDYVQVGDVRAGAGLGQAALGGRSDDLILGMQSVGSLQFRGLLSTVTTAMIPGQSVCGGALLGEMQMTEMQSEGRVPGCGAPYLWACTVPHTGATSYG